MYFEYFTTTFYAIKNYIVDYLSRKLGVFEFLRGARYNHLKYSVNGERYTVLFPVARGPKKWMTVCANLTDDVTRDVDAVAGPCHNFHGIPTTPKMLGFDSLRFVCFDGRELVFEKDDVIKF
jgi:hypothetical protein